MESVIKSFELLKELPLAKWHTIKEQADLEKFHFPYYLKADISGHKTDSHAILKVEDHEHAKSSLKWIHQKFPENKIIAQENFEGIEMIVGIKTDKVFGKLLMIGFGGIFAEVKKDISFRSLPVTKKDIKEMISELKGSAVFTARGKNYNVENLITTIQKITELIDKKKIKEMDLNPIIMSEKKSLIVDARIELE